LLFLNGQGSDTKLRDIEQLYSSTSDREKRKNHHQHIRLLVQQLTKRNFANKHQNTIDMQTIKRSLVCGLQKCKQCIKITKAANFCYSGDRALSSKISSAVFALSWQSCSKRSLLHRMCTSNFLKSIKRKQAIGKTNSKPCTPLWRRVRFASGGNRPPLDKEKVARASDFDPH